MKDNLPRLRDEWRLDFVVVNGENASNGMGLSGAHAKLLLEAGADVISWGAGEVCLGDPGNLAVQVGNDS